MEVKFDSVKDIILAAFPDASSRRTVHINTCETFTVSDYWSEGSRDETRFVKLDTLQVVSATALPSEARQKAANPFGLAIAEVKMVPGIAIVVHTIFRGKDLGYRVSLHKENMMPILPAAPSTEVDERDKRILASFRGLKSGAYRQEALRALNFSEADRTRLADKGFLRVSANGATAITIEGKLICQDTRVS
jgi:hypothetical protein